MAKRKPDRRRDVSQQSAGRQSKSFKLGARRQRAHDARHTTQHPDECEGGLHLACGPQLQRCARGVRSERGLSSPPRAREESCETLHCMSPPSSREREKGARCWEPPGSWMLLLLLLLRMIDGNWTPRFSGHAQNTRRPWRDWLRAGVTNLERCVFQDSVSLRRASAGPGASRTSPFLLLNPAVGIYKTCSGPGPRLVSRALFSLSHLARQPRIRPIPPGPGCCECSGMRAIEILVGTPNLRSLIEAAARHHHAKRERGLCALHDANASASASARGEGGGRGVSCPIRLDDGRNLVWIAGGLAWSPCPRAAKLHRELRACWPAPTSRGCICINHQQLTRGAAINRGGAFCDVILDGVVRPAARRGLAGCTVDG